MKRNNNKHPRKQHPALLLIKEGEYQAAIELFQKNPPDFSFDHVYHAECWMEMKNYQKAIEILTKIPAHYMRNSPLYYILLSKAYYKNGQKHLAFKTLEQTPITARDDNYYQRFISALIAQERYDDGEKEIKKFLVNYPNSKRKLEVLNDYTRLLRQKNQFATALEIMRTIRENFPETQNKEDYIVSYVNILKLNNEFKEAERMIAPLMALPNPSENVLSCMAFIKTRQKEPKQAIPLLVDILKKNPKNHKIRLFYALEKSSDLKEMQQILKPLLDDVDCKPLFKAAAWVQIAIMHYDLNDFEKAEERALQALSLEKNYAPAYSLLGHLYSHRGYDKGQESKARYYFRQAELIDPKRFAAKHPLPRDLMLEVSEVKHQSRIESENNIKSELASAISNPKKSTQKKNKSLPPWETKVKTNFFEHLEHYEEPDFSEKEPITMTATRPAKPKIQKSLPPSQTIERPHKNLQTRLAESEEIKPELVSPVPIKISFGFGRLVKVWGFMALTTPLLQSTTEFLQLDTGLVEKVGMGLAFMTLYGLLLHYSMPKPQIRTLLESGLFSKNTQVDSKNTLTTSHCFGKK